MHASDFEQSNKVYDTPRELSPDECEPLNTFVGEFPNGRPVIITCWKPTHDELERIIATGRVWVYHLGRNLQPHFVSGDDPFSENG